MRPEWQLAADLYGPAILLAKCPKCLALPGDRCVTDGRIVGPHHERSKYAGEMQRQFDKARAKATKKRRKRP